MLAMKEAEPKRANGCVIAFIVALVPVLYVISADLANVAIDRGFMSQSTYDVIYAPLFWLVEWRDGPG